MLSFAAALIVALSAVSTVVAADCTRQYTVEEGDWCDSISASNSVSTYQLATLNQPAINAGCTNLVPDQVVCLAANPAEDCKTLYSVKSGDTCNEIIEAHNGLNATLLHLNNPQIDEDCGNIYVGEVLCVATSAQVPPGTGAVIKPPTTVATKPPPKDTTPPPPPPKDSNAAPADGEDEDDSDLPYCDEIDP